MGVLSFIFGNNEMREDSRDSSSYSRPSETRPSEKRNKRYKAYCRICGCSTSTSRSSPGAAISDLQMSYGRCGLKNHTPEAYEVDD